MRSRSVSLFCLLFLPISLQSAEFTVVTAKLKATISDTKISWTKPESNNGDSPSASLELFEIGEYDVLDHLVSNQFIQPTNFNAQYTSNSFVQNSIFTLGNNNISMKINGSTVPELLQLDVDQMAPIGSILLTYTIDHWPFESPSNHLRLAFLVSSTEDDIKLQPKFVNPYSKNQTLIAIKLVGIEAVWESDFTPSATLNDRSSHVPISLLLRGNVAVVYVDIPYFEGKMEYISLVSFSTDILEVIRSHVGATTVGIVMGTLVGCFLLLAALYSWWRYKLRREYLRHLLVNSGGLNNFDSIPFAHQQL